MSPEAISDDTRVLSPKERRRRNRDEMIAGILDAARGVMRRQGVSALNLNEVARQVGIRTQSLYEYFPNKAAIYDALFLMGVRLYREQVERAVQAHGPVADRIRAAFESYMRFAQENPDLYQLVFERPVPGFVPSDASMDESRQLLAMGAEAMAEIVTEGILAPGLPPPQAMDLLIAVMHGLTAQHMANEPHLPVGSGRFGSLVPAAVALFEAAWTPARDDTVEIENEQAQLGLSRDRDVSGAAGAA